MAPGMTPHSPVRNGPPGPGPTRVAVLGSTGSVGEQALDVVRSMPDRFRVAALAAGLNTARLRAQLDEFRPAAANVRVGLEADALRTAFPDTDWPSLEEIAVRDDVDVVMVATSGLAGLAPTIAALRAAGALRLVAQEPGMPCRVSMAHIAPGEDVVLDLMGYLVLLRIAMREEEQVK